jgi:hypothetical protein
MNARRLTGQVVEAADLDPVEVAALYALHARLYAAASETAFRVDLAEKDWVVVLRDDGGVIRGFSTLRLLHLTVDGTELRAIFSGDTGIDPAYWGGQALVRAWAGFMGELRARDPKRPLYWFLISKGYRTYLYLPYFFHAFYPRHDRPTPAFEQAVMDGLGRLKFGGAYDPATGLVTFPESHGHLAEDLTDVPAHRQADPHVRFFLARNPGYVRGDELVCLAEIGPTNMKGLARRRLVESAPAMALAG